ncbi:MAG: hypothetical protein CVU34_08970 [Betaproteobacteria bacterium HGW-Betaproteobacteria-7]|jgi:tRNA A-37 threonylcarbamoyl transferase component Bud32|nr:MAG: hypothetical protein CVU34_08970 [Betaproteobacteria bacterium HGW-Betaproteobacteria-7]
MSNAVVLQALRDGGRQPVLPFEIELPDGRWLTFAQLLRLLPGRRLAGLALWNGQNVFAKLFIGKDAVRHGERERAGLAALKSAALPTPDVYFAAPVADGGYLVLSEYLDGAVALDEQPLSADDPRPLLPAMALLGRMHAAGVVHRDLHPGNFLRHGAHLLLIDGDGVRSGALAAAQAINLALFLAQLTPDWDERRSELLQAYARPVDTAALGSAVDAARQGRLRHFLAKTVRDCSQFAVSRDLRRFAVVLREEQDELRSLLADPDAAMAGGRLLKDGGTCTVAAVRVAGRTLVVKRYNLKHWRHALSRAWRPSRAWHSWQAAHRLAFYGIATPRPLALIEERAGPLRGRAFLIAEHCPGINLLDDLDPAREPEAELQQALCSLFRTLHQLRISHGDLKATNLLWHDGEIVLIDLDALVEHRSASTFARAWRRDRARLLRNWPAGSPLAQWLQQILPGS